MPGASVLETRAGEVRADFKCGLKAPCRITHIQRLKDAADSLSYLLEIAGALKERLGRLLFQLPPNLKKDMLRLRKGKDRSGVASRGSRVKGPRPLTQDP
jgi:uncharacterized protein YecE (DUF72 family)